MRRSTRVVAWLWLAASVYMVLKALAPLKSGIEIGLIYTVARSAHRIDVFGLVALAGAVGLLTARAWGWWMMMVYAVLSMGLLGISFALHHDNMVIHGSPLVVWPLFSVALLLWLAAISVIAIDPPWRWRRINWFETSVSTGLGSSPERSSEV